MPKSVAIDKVFESRVTQLQAEIAHAEFLRANGLGRWLHTAVDKDEVTKIVDGFDHDEIKASFSRDGTSHSYLTAVDAKDPGSAADAKVAKVQGDVLSAMERDTRLRYRSRARLQAHGEAKHRSHGLAAGPITGSILQYVRSIIQPGAIEPTAERPSTREILGDI